MKIAIFGASGLAAEVADLCLDLGCETVVFIDRAQPGTPLRVGMDAASVVPESHVGQLASEGFSFVIAIGDPLVRRRISHRFPDLPYTNIIHPDTSFGAHLRLRVARATGNIVLAGVRMTTCIRLGDFGIYNQNCTVAHDCIVEDYVTIGPGANVSGNVWLEEGAYVGSGSVILQGASETQKRVIGRFAVVGAGAVVTRDVAQGRTVKGVPAR